MVIANFYNKKCILILFKEFAVDHTITSLANELKLSRVGMWKLLKKLESDIIIKLNPVGYGKTSTSIVKLNWDNPLLEKTLTLYLTEETLMQRRWQSSFAELEKKTDFTILFGSILYSTKEAKDIDIINVVSQKKKFIDIQKIIDKIQKTQIKKIHSINFTKKEFKEELTRSNNAIMDAIKKSIVLFGQDNFIQFIKGVNQK